MRKSLYFLTLFLCAFFSQAQLDSSTYVSGQISTEFQNTTTLTDESFGCGDTLRVTIGTGRYVTGVDVYYSFEADSTANAWVSEQSSYLEFLNTNTKEGAITYGDPNWDSSGTLSYSRTGISIANGLSATGDLDFFLHAFRSFGNFPNCGSNFQNIVDSTWKIVVHHIPAPSCTAPTALAASANTFSSIDLNWTTGGATAWQVGYRVAGSAAALTYVSALTNPFTLSGLAPGTNYDIYVRDSCALGDVSFWLGPITANTVCSPTAAPWLENFDSANWITGTGGTNAGNSIDFCWTRPTGNPNFGTRIGGTASGGSGPSADKSGTGNYLYTEASNGAVGPGEIVSPWIIVSSSITKPQLRFFYHMYGNNITSLQVQVDNGSGFGASLLTITGGQQLASTDPWEDDTLGLSAFSGDTIRLKFIGTNAGFNGDIAIDEVEIREAPTCFIPDSLVAGNPSPTSVDLSWNTGGSSNWQVGYRVSGSTGALTIVAAGTNPFTLSGLSAATTYEFFVKDSCAVGNSSDWGLPTTMATLCNPSIAPWTENFDATNWTTGAGGANTGNIIDVCWSRPNSNNPNFGTRTGGTNSAGSGPSADASGTGNYLYTEASGSPGAGEISSPWVVVSSSIVDPTLHFSYHMYGNNIQTLEVQVDNGAGFGTTLKTISGAQQTASTDAWKKDTLDLTAFSGDTIRVRFVGTNNGFNGDIAIDEVAINVPPACLDPQNLILDFARTNSATFSWLTGGASAWQLEYGAIGHVAGTGTIVNTLTNPGSINGLTANTTYDVYVRDSCGVGVVSAWVGPITITTLCTPYTAPFSENFDSTAIWTTGANNVALGTIDNCWRRYPTDQFAWKTGPAPQQSTFSGTAIDHTTGSGQFIYSERVANPVNGIVETFMETPPIIITGLTNPQLKFWYHMYGNSLVGLEVEINNGSGWSNIYTKNGQQQTSGTDPWKEAIVNLSTYLGDTVVVRFMSTINNGGTNNDVSIDDVSIDEAPSCPKPQDVAVVGYTNTSVTVGWTAGGSATNWNIEYGAPGFTVGTGTYVSASTNPFTITGLTPNTAYEFYVRDSCGIADVSVWVGSDSATTDCNPVSAPLVENFDGTAWTIGAGQNPGNLANCWRRAPDAGYVYTTGQNGTPTGNTGPAGDNTSGTGKFIYTETYFNFGGYNPNEASLMTPLVDLSTLTSPELKFYYHFFGADITKMEVNVFDGTSWTNVHTYNGQTQTANADAWKEQIIDLIAFANDTIKVEFKATKGVGNTTQADMALDDVSIDEKPLCPKPDSLMVSNPTTTSLDLSWISGGATNWVIEYGPIGFTPGAGTKVHVSTNPYTVTGLSPSKAYDFYVRDSCGVGAISDSVGPVFDNTLCAPILAPYLETFDGANFDPGPAGFGVAGTIDACWTRNTVATYFWKAGPSTPQTTGTGSSIGDHTSGSGQYLFTESGGFSGPPLNAEATTPEIDLSSLTTPELRYWYHMFGPNVNDLYVEVSNNGGLNYTAVDTLSGNQQASQADAWKEAIVDISTYANDTIIVRFRAEKTSNGNQSDISIDDVQIDEAPSCPKPTNLITSNPTATTIDLSWTTGGASNWRIEYGPVGFTLGTGIQVSAGSNPFTITGLSPKTGYCFYVRDSCGLNDLSDWSVVSCDSTDCGVFTAPWSESFDGPDWVSGAGGANNGNVISSCWFKPNSNNPNFGTRSGSTNSNGTGPSADISGTGNYIYTEASGSQGTGEISTPQIFIPSTITSPRLTFGYHMYGTAIDSLEIRISSNGGAFTRIGGLVGAQQSANGDPWLYEIIDLTSYSGDTVQIKFLGTNSGFAGDIAVDSVVIEQAPTCPNPTNLLVTSTTAGSATLAWTTGGASNWQIEYGLTGFANGTGTIVNAGTNPFTVTGLLPNTGYDFYVRDSCGATDVSVWSLLADDTTRCSVFAAPYFENFDGPTFVVGGSFANPGSIDPCWERTFANSYFWAVEQNGTLSANTGPSQDHTTGAGKFMFTDGNQTPQNTELKTPDIDLSPLNHPELRFWYHMYGNSINKLEVDVWNGTAWVNETTINGAQQTSSNDPWTEVVVSLSAYANDTIQVRFNGFRAGFQTSNDIAIDDVWIGDSTSCQRPDSLILVTATKTSLNISWVSYSGLGSVIKYRPAGSTGPFSFASVLGNTTTLNGLLPSTIYEVFVKDSCGVSTTSLYTAGQLFSTLCGPIIAPWSENFDGAGWVPGAGAQNAGDQIQGCWTRSTNTGRRWTTGTGGTPSNGTGPNGDVNGNGQYLYTEASIGTGTTEIESPQIVVPMFLSNPVLEFSYHMFGNGITSFAIEIDNGSGYQNVKTITGAQQNGNGAAWLNDTVNLTAFLGDTITVKFVGVNTAFTGDIAIDEISINGQITNCADPASIVFSNISSTGATIGWVSNSNISNVEVVPSSQAQGTGTFYKGVTSPLNVVSLLPGTAYTVYINDSCGTTISNWIDSTFTTTSCLALTGAITFSSVTATSVTVNWTSNSSVSEIEVVPQGQAQGTGTTYTPVVSPYVVNGLNPNTQYVFYIRDLCGANSSGWIQDSTTTSNCSAVVAAFVANENLLSVAFNSSGTLGADTLNWTFGDGNGTMGPSPTHVYSTPGTYMVTLIASNGCGNSDTTTMSITICDSLLADFAYNQISGREYNFDASGSVGAISYRWDFAGAHDTTGVTTVYEFTSSGTKTVTLWVYNSCGDSVSVSKNITVCLPAIAKWTYNIISTTSAGMNVQFDGSATTNATSYEWDFGDGSAKVTGQVMPTHLYLTPGLFYTVTLKVTNSCGEINISKLKLSQMVGLIEIKTASNVLLYPNPAKNQVSIEWDALQYDVKELKVVDLHGKLLSSQNIDKDVNGHFELNISNLPDGQYIIQLVTDKGIIRRNLQIK